MGARGPTKKPTALRLLGGARPDKVNQHEPKASATSPVCPKAAAPDVREVWEYVVAELETMHIASSADRDPLLCYCEAVVSHRKASAVLAKTGVLVKGIGGQPVRNPALQIQRDAAGVIRAFAREFGLTPAARAGIEVVKLDVESSDPFADFG